MDRKRVSHEAEAWGRGQVQGHTIIDKYKCPCGKGFIVTEQDTHVGHKQRITTIECKECIQKYKILNETSYNWSLVPLE